LAWKIEFHPATEKELRALSGKNRKRVFRFLRDRVASRQDPRSIGGPLRGPELGRLWKYRVGPIRVVCDIQDKRIVILVVRVAHRKEVYR